MVRQLRAQGRDVRALVRRWDAEQRLMGTGASAVLGDVTGRPRWRRRWRASAACSTWPGWSATAPPTTTGCSESTSRAPETCWMRPPAPGSSGSCTRPAWARWGRPQPRVPAQRAALPARRRRRPRRLPLLAVEGAGRGAGAGGGRRRPRRGGGQPRLRDRPGRRHTACRPGRSRSTCAGVVRFMVRGGLSYVDVRDVAAGHLLAEQRGRLRPALHPHQRGGQPRPTPTSSPASAAWPAAAAGR